MSINTLSRRTCAVMLGAFVASGIAAGASTPAYATGDVASCRVTAGTGCTSNDVNVISIQKVVRLQVVAPAACSATFRVAEKTSGSTVHSGVVPRGTSHVESPHFLYGIYRLEIVDSCIGASAELDASP
jgi:hypothetical protein